VPDDLLALATTVAGWANDGEQVEAYVSRSTETSVVVYQGEVETLKSAGTEGVTVRVVVGDRQGISYATVLDETAVKEALEEARDNAAFSSPDEFAGLAEPDRVAPSDTDFWRDDLASFPTEEKIALAIELERMILAGDSRIKAVPQSGWGDIRSESALVSSAGISVTSRRTACTASAYCLAGEENQTGFGFAIGRTFGDIDIEAAARDAIERGTRLLGAKKGQSTKLTVVFDPYVTAQVLGILGGTLSGEAVLKGRSLFANRVGEQVAASSITLVDDPTDPRAYGATTYDAEGLACRRNVLIDGGGLQGYLYNSHAARRAGTTSTGSAVRASLAVSPSVGARALSVLPGTQSQAEIISGVDNGLLVQNVHGLHSGVDPVSGDFSVGAEGLRIRNGQLAEPVREITVASTIQRMLLDVQAVGSDLQWLPMAAAGVTLAIPDVSMSGD
jgi:PmbA protein